ncbi:UL116 [Papio ursinus cytomegalovirus]|uniref:UL116 n=1 Tax=Papiine betaherpesvirus 4 TaxID=2560624 RepID=A0A0F7G998_9BETA|nr:UL116 [Papio ursinus cytomegalovirus]AKG51581.1 UL116 [Papiine betaherpesvirus 4]
MQEAMKTWVLLVALFAITRDSACNNTSTASSSSTSSNTVTSSKANNTTSISSSTVSSTSPSGSSSATSNTTKATTSPATTNLSSASPASSPATATTNSTTTTPTPTSSKNTSAGSSTPTNTSNKTSPPASNTSTPSATKTANSTTTNNSAAENTTNITPTFSTENVTVDSNFTTGYPNDTFNATTDPYEVMQIVDLCNATISIIFTDSDEETEESDEQSSEEQQSFDSIDDNTYYPVNPSYSLLSDSDDVMYFYANCERNDTLSNTSCNYTNQRLTSWSLVSSVSFYPAELTNCNKPVAVIEVGNSSLVVSAEATSNLVDGIYKVLGVPDLNSSFLKELAKFQQLIIQGQNKPQK